ncbi:MAG: PorP/SprF family type IX secretion system membrane protein [Tannerellaceae bacterium]|jgi:type IX secretion system PorP/SprF family membrane protein|nr:PorP/SprF family type IX secretion system membrane protein [Tannerellaceae bacterium]
MLKRLFLLIIGLEGSVAAAQNDAFFSHYFITQGYYNPAYAGATSDMNITVIHKQQWIGMPGAPKPLFAMVDRPFQAGKASIGAGLSLYQESIGLFSNSNISAQIAIKQKLFGGVLSIGIQPGLFSTTFDGTNIKWGESPENQEEDEAVPKTELTGMTFDFNAGAYFQLKNLYLGFGMMHVLSPEYELDQNTTSYIDRTYNLLGGYNIQLKDTLFELQPSFLAITDMQTFQMEITGRLLYNKMFSGGLSWRINSSVVAFLGASFNNVEAGYAYDYPVSAINKVSSGSHEVVLRYRFKLDKAKTGNYKHKSVRLL